VSSQTIVLGHRINIDRRVTLVTAPGCRGGSGDLGTLAGNFAWSVTHEQPSPFGGVIGAWVP
jgi:Flp pilus assembly CpaE family ATPase